MLKKPKSNKKQTISEKVTTLIAKSHKAATDDSSELSDDSVDSTRVADFDDDEYETLDKRTTAIRKRNIKLLDEQSQRYKGEVVARNKLRSDNDDDSDNVDDSEDYDDNDNDDEFDNEATDSEPDDVIDSAFNDISKPKRDIENGFYDNDDTSDDGTDADEAVEDDDEDDDDGDDADDFLDESDIESDASNTNDTKNNLVNVTNQQVEAQKGHCVQNQLHIWEKLLELRIHTQKFLTKSNQLPNLNKQQHNENVELKNAATEVAQQTSKLLQTLLALQTTLQKQNPEVNEALKKTLKRKSCGDVAINDMAPPLKRLATEISDNFHEFRNYRNSVLLKWYDRTKLLTPNAGVKKKASLHEEYDIVKKIESALANRAALIEKTQQLKNTKAAHSSNANNNNENIDVDSSSNSKVNGVATTDAPELTTTLTNVNIYDDSDFYHQQLRELIEYKASTTANIKEVTKQYIELQKLRQKMKKKVDTRASKGRKLRYVVHKKLINFMAPNDTTTWTDESKDELYKSLFAA